MSNSNSIENMLLIAFKDRISNILLKYSNLTAVQFETYIIDILTDNMTDNELTYEKKKIFRSKKVSRGAFSRTLSQCRRNIISSMFTILLLYYIGLFEGSPLDEFQELSHNLREYSDSIKNFNSEFNAFHLKNIERELLTGIENLSKPKSLKSM